MMWEFVFDNTRNRIDLDMIYLIFSLLHVDNQKSRKRTPTEEERERKRHLGDDVGEGET